MLDEIRQVITFILRRTGMELVELTLRREAKPMVLRLLVDRPEGGISLNECAALNERIGRVLDEKQLMKESYILEVSSPGLDRPLRSCKDFGRARGREVRFVVCESICGKTEFVGRIKETERESIVVEVAGGEIRVPIEKIVRAKQVISI